MRPPRPLPSSAEKRLTQLLDQVVTKADDQRVLCVWWRVALGMPAAEIATALGWRLGSVPNLHSQYRHEGTSSLVGSGRGGRRRELLTLAEEEKRLSAFVGRRIEREYSYAYAAVSPHDGALVSLVLPEVNAEWMSLFLAEVAQRCVRTFVLMVLEGAGWRRAKDLVMPANMRLEALPARSPELNPAEHLWEERREKWLGNQLFLHQQAGERQVEKSLAALEADPQRVASLAGFHWIQKIPLTPT